MKLRRKLLSAGLALGASALTLTTSTFAWYTQNSEATVGQITGATEAGTETNLFVSSADTFDASYTPTHFTGFVPSLTPVCTIGVDVSDHKLRPVAYEAGTYKKIDNANTTNTTANTTASYLAHDEKDIFSYTLRFNGNTSQNIYFKTFNLSFTGSTTMIAINHGTVSAGGNNHNTGITSAGAYWASLAKALKLTVTYQPLEESDSGVSGYALTGTSSTRTFALDSFAQGADSNITSANAVGYYNSVFGTNLSTASTNGTVAGTSISSGEASATNALVLAPTGTTGVVEVKFVFWLDGWDEYCYDVMMNQSFNFSFVATTDSSAAVVHTA